MNPTNWRRAGVGAALVLTCGAAIEITRAQEQTKKKYPYPTCATARGDSAGPEGPAVQQPAARRRPVQFETYEQRNIRVSVVTKGLSHPWSVAFLPGGDMLITERVGRLRVVRNGVLDAGAGARHSGGRPRSRRWPG